MTHFERRALRIVPILLALPVLFIGGYLGYSRITRNSLWVANHALAKREIPRLPASAVVLNYDEGGFMAAWLFLKVRVNENAIKDYESGLSFEKCVIGKEPGMVWIVESNVNSDDLLESKSKVQFRELLKGGQPWWDTTAITDGIMYSHHDDKKAEQIHIYVDHGRNLIYIYWCYS